MKKKFSEFLAKEDGAPANAAGSGNVAGIGIPAGPGKGEPGISPINKYKNKNAKDEKNIILGGLMKR